MNGLPKVTVTEQPAETLTFADGTTVTRWSRTIHGGAGDLPLHMNNYLITSPGGNHITASHSYCED